MLNRRTLRVKAMQALFAFEQCKEANLNVAKQGIKEAFQPDLNSMEIQDPQTLKSDRKAAVKLFNQFVVDGEVSDVPEDTPEISVEEAKKAIEFYKTQVSQDFKVIKKRMITEADSIYYLYIRILGILPHFRSFAENGTGFKKSESQAQQNLVNNLLIQTISEDPKLEAISLKNNLGWDGDIEILRSWFKDIIVKEEAYQDYIKLKEPTAADDYEIVNEIIRRIIFKNETIENYFETQNINWIEDRPIVRSLVLKTIKSARDSGSDYELAMLSYNWDEDKEFFEKLFETTIEEENFLQELVAEKTKNWEFERIAYTDRLILMLAVCEMIHFPSIPVKVTINEYIEVSKAYSTPKSKQFVNGVLDVIAVDLQEKGLIKKSGRGLIDNK